MSRSDYTNYLDSRTLARINLDIERGQPVVNAVHSLFKRRGGRFDSLLVGIIKTCGIEPFAEEISRMSGLSLAAAAHALEDALQRITPDELSLTGAEAAAVILHNAGIQTAFTFPGTSELALCESLGRLSGFDLVNGRGDKECAFLAAGASLLKPCPGVAILHGSRGLTNAAGAIADIRRNEIATVFIVGLPNTHTARFLPPHGELDLMQSVGNFVKWWYQSESIPPNEVERAKAASNYLDSLYTAIEKARSTPYGPTMFGIPQDVAEKAWIPLRLLIAPESLRNPSPPQAKIQTVTELLARHKRPLILIDDYLLKYQAVSSTLARFSELIGAPVLQIRYRRGPMLFERLTPNDVPNFIGWLDSDSREHRSILNAADLLITLEDRNMYHRVIGELPNCRKIAISSDGGKVRKNEYLREADLLIESDVLTILRAICEHLTSGGIAQKNNHWVCSKATPKSTGRIVGAPAVESLRTGIVKSIAQVMAEFDAPVLVDDSQMFGGLISEYYDLLPEKLRVFGDHGGFVGSGIGYATGLAIADPTVRVFCFLGDQGFVNGIQGLTIAMQERARVIFLVCNNGGSVSLLKQSLNTGGVDAPQTRQHYLANTPQLEYVQIAAGFGISASGVDLSTVQSIIEAEQAVLTLKGILAKAMSVNGPSLIELRLPGLSDFWDGVWRAKGYDEVT